MTFKDLQREQQIEMRALVHTVEDYLSTFDTEYGPLVMNRMRQRVETIRRLDDAMGAIVAR